MEEEKKDDSQMRVTFYNREERDSVDLEATRNMEKYKSANCDETAVELNLYNDSILNDTSFAPIIDKIEERNSQLTMYETGGLNAE